jgi:hypothetical protein
VQALELELDFARLPHAHESSGPFLHNADPAVRLKRIEIVVPPNAFRAAPPAVPVLPDDAYLGLDPRTQVAPLTDTGKELAIDVTISSAASDMSLGLRDGLTSATSTGLAAVRAAFKKREYLPFLRRDYTSLRVFAVETLGYGSKQAMHILERIAEHRTGSVLEHGQWFRSVLRRIWQRVSVALHSAVSYRVMRFIQAHAVLMGGAAVVGGGVG